jgi:ABC-type nitrate/sulfonate/bicarbonate transport system substrate-binding protein
MLMLESSNRIRRASAALALLAMYGLCLFACSRRQAAASGAGGVERLTLRYEGSTNNVSMPELAEDLGFLAPLKLEYIGNNATGGPHSIQSVVTGDIDFGTSFNGAIINLVAAKAPVRAVLAAYGTDAKLFAGFYTLEDSAIRGPRDLIGKKVAMNTLGAHSEFVLREYLARGGLTPAESKQVTMLVLPPLNAEQALRNHQVDLIAISTYLRDKAAPRGPLRMLFSDYQMYGAFNAGSIVMSNLFLARYPAAARKFVQATGAAIDWARNQPRDEVVARFECIIRARKRGENTDSVRYWQSSGVSTQHALIEERDYQLWIDWLIKAGQLKPGQIKARDIYTNEYNAQASAPGTPQVDGETARQGAPERN